MSEHFVNVVAENFAGKRCTCCSLFSIAFTLVKSPARWIPYDSNNIKNV